MTYRNYRNALHKTMMSYLHFMKHCDTDEQLLALNAEANLLRVKIASLDKKTASEMLETVKFNEFTYESDGFPDGFIPSQINVVPGVMQQVKDNAEPTVKSAYKGIDYERGMFRAVLKFRGKTYLDEKYKTEEIAVKARDNAILKYHLPNPLHELKKP